LEKLNLIQANETMIKRTLHFGNPAYLNLRNGQLDIKLTEENRQATVPIEDIGVVVLDHQQITISHGALAALLENNAAVIVCNGSHLPTGLMMPLDSNSLQNERFRAQVTASEPLKKQLWQQTVQAKIRNQAAVLQAVGQSDTQMKIWANEVKSGDTDNREAHAAAWYWPRVFTQIPGFLRQRGGSPPNQWLNYGYAILRAIVARNLVGSGLLPTLGIHHANKYNAYCLADDIMEPYRPYVDWVVINMMTKHALEADINKAHKADLLQIPVLDVYIAQEKSPLMVAVQRTTASLAKCFQGASRKITYPSLQEVQIENNLPF
jgi:CRISPR-associated protein Cas1